MKSAAITKGWPPARRKLQARRIRRTRPWRFSTGPRTCAGKQRACMNGLRHGARRAAVREFLSLLAAQRRYVRLVNALLDARYCHPEPQAKDLPCRSLHGILRCAQNDMTFCSARATSTPATQGKDAP